MKFDLRFTEAPFTAFCDWYQLTQLQALMHQMSHAGGIRIRMSYAVRSRGANTARLRAAVREALDRFEDRHVILPEELPFLREVRYIKPVFLDDLRDLRLHPRDGRLVALVSGPRLARRPPVRALAAAGRQAERDEDKRNPAPAAEKAALAESGLTRHGDSDAAEPEKFRARAPGRRADRDLTGTPAPGRPCQ